ncbi:hypothetical protein M885DRAFT_598573 [Pelagophyceae sp. CCMP2097]|nr:hypothetical protein M885DRAFT_598573 [Pelagophyceae sp. CCMP2097]
MGLPRFGGAAKRAKRASLLGTGDEIDPSDLRAAALVALDALCSRDGGALRGRLEALVPRLFGESSLDVERDTLDAAQRKTLEARVVAFVRALAPYAGLPDAVAPLEYVAVRYDALAWCADELAAALLPWHATSPLLARVLDYGSVCDALKPLANKQGGGARKGDDVIPRRALASRCAADAAFVELLCAGAASAAASCDAGDSEDEEAARTVARIHAPLFAFFAATLTEAVELCAFGRSRERLERLARWLVAPLSRCLRYEATSASAGYRVAAYCVVVSLCASARLAAAVIDAVAFDCVDNESALRPALLRRTLATTLVVCAAKRGGDGRVAQASFVKLVNADGFAEQVRRLALEATAFDDADARRAARALLAMLAPQLGALSCADDEAADVALNAVQSLLDVDGASDFIAAPVLDGVAAALAAPPGDDGARRLVLKRAERLAAHATRRGAAVPADLRLLLFGDGGRAADDEDAMEVEPAVFGTEDWQSSVGIAKLRLQTPACAATAVAHAEALWCATAPEGRNDLAQELGADILRVAVKAMVSGADLQVDGDDSLLFAAAVSHAGGLVARVLDAAPAKPKHVSFVYGAVARAVKDEARPAAWLDLAAPLVRRVSMPAKDDSARAQLHAAKCALAETSKPLLVAIAADAGVASAARSDAAVFRALADRACLDGEDAYARYVVAGLATAAKPAAADVDAAIALLAATKSGDVAAACFSSPALGTLSSDATQRQAANNALKRCLVVFCDSASVVRALAAGPSALFFTSMVAEVALDDASESAARAAALKWVANLALGIKNKQLAETLVLAAVSGCASQSPKVREQAVAACAALASTSAHCAFAAARKASIIADAAAMKTALLLDEAQASLSFFVDAALAPLSGAADAQARTLPLLRFLGGAPLELAWHDGPHAALEGLLASSAPAAAGVTTKISVGGHRKAPPARVAPGAQAGPWRAAVAEVLLEAYVALSRSAAPDPRLLASALEHASGKVVSVALRGIADSRKCAGLEEAAKARLFGGVLAVLRADAKTGPAAGAEAVDRSDALAALEALGVAPRAWKRVWAASMKRSVDDVAAFAADASTLLEAMAVTLPVGTQKPQKAELAPHNSELPLYAALERVASANGGGAYDYVVNALLDRIGAAASCAAELALLVDLARSEKQSAQTRDAALRALASTAERSNDAALRNWRDLLGLGTSMTPRFVLAVVPAVVAAKLATAPELCNAVVASKNAVALLLKPKTGASKSGRAANSQVYGDDGARDEAVYVATLAALASTITAAAAGRDDDGEPDARGVAAVALVCLSTWRRRPARDGRAERFAEGLLAKFPAARQLDSMVALAQAGRALFLASLVPDMLEAEDEPKKKKKRASGASEEGQAFGRETRLFGDHGPRFSVSDVAADAAEARALALAAASLVMQRVGAVAAELESAASDRDKLALCHELALTLASVERCDDLAEALQRAVKEASVVLLRDAAFVAFVERLLQHPSLALRETAVSVLHDRLHSTRLIEAGRAGEGKATAFAELLLSELAPFVARALSGSDKPAAFTAAKAADVLARALAAHRPQPFGALVEAAATAAVTAARSRTGSQRARQMFALLDTLFATLRTRALPVLHRALPKALDALQSGCVTTSFDLKDAATHTLLVIAASVPQFLHAHLAQTLDLLTLLHEAADDSIEEDAPQKVVVEARAEASESWRVARALAAGIEPRLLLPAWYAAHARAKALEKAPRAGSLVTGRRSAAALLLARPAVEALGRGAARQHAAPVASFALGALLEAAEGSAAQAAAVELSVALLHKLTENELQEWLEAAKSVGLAPPPDDALQAKSDGLAHSRRKAALFLVVATVVDRFEALAAPHAAAALLDEVELLLGEGSAALSYAPLKHRVVGTLTLILRHAVSGDAEGGLSLEAEERDVLIGLLVPQAKFDPYASSHDDFASFAKDALAPCVAQLAAVSDERQRRELNKLLMLLARDGNSLPTRTAALHATAAIVESVQESVAEYANQMVQAVSECLEDPDTALLAHAIVVQVESLCGIRLC